MIGTFETKEIVRSCYGIEIDQMSQTKRTHVLFYALLAQKKIYPCPTYFNLLLCFFFYSIRFRISLSV